MVVCSGAIPEGAAAPQGVQMAPKTGDLNYVRTAVRTAIRAAGVVSRERRPEPDASEMPWRD